MFCSSTEIRCACEPFESHSARWAACRTQSLYFIGFFLVRFTASFFYSFFSSSFVFFYLVFLSQFTVVGDSVVALHGRSSRLSVSSFLLLLRARSLLFRRVFSCLFSSCVMRHIHRLPSLVRRPTAKIWHNDSLLQTHFNLFGINCYFMYVRVGLRAMDLRNIFATYRRAAESLAKQINTKNICLLVLRCLHSLNQWVSGSLLPPDLLFI